MSVVVISSPTWVQGSSYIGHDNLFLRSDAVVTGSVEDAGFPATNATRWPTYGGGWQATPGGDLTLTVRLLDAAVNANSYGLYKHNLSDLGVTVKLQYSSDGSAWTDFTGSEFVPATNDVIYRIDDTPISAAHWRIHMTGLTAGEVVKIGHAFIGESLRLFSPPADGWAPPLLAKNDDYINSRSDGGEFLGRSLIRKGNKTMFSIPHVAESWVRANWEPLLVAVQEHPFYHAWDSANFPEEVAYCYTEKTVKPVRYESSKFFMLNLSFIALTE